MLFYAAIYLGIGTIVHYNNKTIDDNREQMYKEIEKKSEEDHKNYLQKIGCSNNDKCKCARCRHIENIKYYRDNNIPYGDHDDTVPYNSLDKNVWTKENQEYVDRTIKKYNINKKQ